MKSSPTLITNIKSHKDQTSQDSLNPSKDSIVSLPHEPHNKEHTLVCQKKFPFPRSTDGRGTQSSMMDHLRTKHIKWKVLDRLSIIPIPKEMNQVFLRPPTKDATKRSNQTRHLPQDSIQGVDSYMDKLPDKELYLLIISHLTKSPNIYTMIQGLWKGRKIKRNTT